MRRFGNIIFGLILICFMAFASASQAATNSFSKGLEQYEKESYSAAYQHFLNAASTQPKDGRIRLYLARTAYKLRKDSEALKHFASVPRSQLTPDAHYEFGQTLMKVGNHGPAMQHFEEVPKGHPLADLASYFAGFCAVKSKKYGLAEKKFREAEILPGKLAERRKNYLSRLAKIRTVAASKKNRPTIYKPNLSANKQAIPRRRLSQSKKRQIDRIIDQTTSPKPEYKHTGYEGPWQKGNKKRAVIGVDYSQQNSDFHGAQSTDVKYQTVYFDFRNAFHGESATKYKGQRMIYGIQYNAKVETRSSDGEEQRNIIYEDGSDRFRSTANPFSGNGRTNNLVAKFRPYIEAPVGKDTWIAASAYYTRNAIDIDFGEGGGDHGFYLNGLMSNGPLILGLKGAFDFTRNSSHEQMSRSTSAKVYGSFKLGADTSLSPSLKYQTFVYRDTLDEDGNLVFIPGPDSAVIGNLTVKQKFPLGITLSGSVAGSFKNNYITRISASQAPILAQDTEFSANATGIALKAGIGASPIKWVSISAEYSYSFDRYSVDQPDEFPNKESIYEDFTPNIISGFKFGVGVNLIF